MGGRKGGGEEGYICKIRSYAKLKKGQSKVLC